MALGILKTKPEDFVVIESLALKNEHPYDFHYYLLEKCGYTTFESIDKIIDHFKLHNNSISYAGLKDEDGITKQFISSNVELDASLFNELNIKFNNNQGGRFIRLSNFGAGPEKINIGELNGNAFRIVIRQMPKQLTTALFELRKYSSFFINYYGHQRFGIPGSPKNTHLIGENLISQNYVAALNLLRQQKSNLGLRAASFNENPIDFFDNEIKQEMVAFFKSSFHSFKWNEKLKEIIQNESLIKYTQHTHENITYYFISSWLDKLHLAKQLKSLEHTRVVFNCDKFINKKINRSTIVQINLICHNIFEDKLNPGYWAIDCSFFLPTGCYATIAIPQMLEDFSHEFNIDDR